MRLYTDMETPSIAAFWLGSVATRSADWNQWNKISPTSQTSFQCGQRSLCRGKSGQRNVECTSLQLDCSVADVLKESDPFWGSQSGSLMVRFRIVRHSTRLLATLSVGSRTRSATAHLANLSRGEWNRSFPYKFSLKASTLPPKIPQQEDVCFHHPHQHLWWGQTVRAERQNHPSFTVSLKVE